MPHLSLHLLGTFHATLDGKIISNFESNRVRALLAYLAVESDRPHSRDSLAGLLWPDISNRAAHDNLRYALSDLRDVIHDRSANPPFLCITRDTIQFNPASDFQLDAREWQSALEQSPITKLQSLVSTYRGVFLEGFSCDSAPFEEWVLLMRERINQRVLHVLRTLTVRDEERGAPQHLALRDPSFDRDVCRKRTEGIRANAIARADQHKFVLPRERVNARTEELWLVVVDRAKRDID